MTPTARGTRAALLAAAWSAPLATLLPAGNPLRILVVVATGLVLPGLPLALRLPRERRAGERSAAQWRLRLAIMTVALSLGCATVVSQALMLAHALRPVPALVLLAVLTTGAVLAPAGPGSRSWAGPER